MPKPNKFYLEKRWQRNMEREKEILRDCQPLARKVLENEINRHKENHRGDYLRGVSEGKMRMPSLSTNDKTDKGKRVDA